jgi:uncharacterized protein with PhoU and TrkA domain
MDERPRNLKAMLSEAKDTSELMVDLAYGALFFSDEKMAEEVERLEQVLNELVHEMRTICVLAARKPREAEQMSGVLQLVAAIEQVGNAAVDIARIVIRSLGIPAALVADLAGAEEVSHRVRVREESALANRTLAQSELPIDVGMRVMAIRRGKDWITDPDGDQLLMPRDVVFLEGRASGIPRLRELAGAPDWQAPVLEADPSDVSDLSRAVDVLVEMKNISEAAVALAYAALTYNDPTLAAEVEQLAQRLREMHERLELWVLRAGADTIDPSNLRGLLHLGHAAEDIGDAAEQMVWIVEQGEEPHPVLALALGWSEEVTVRLPVAAGAPLDGLTVVDARIASETGFTVLAVRRAGQYLYRNRARIRLRPGDELLAIGPDEGRQELAELCGFDLREDDVTGEIELVPAV